MVLLKTILIEVEIKIILWLGHTDQLSDPWSTVYFKQEPYLNLKHISMLFASLFHGHKNECFCTILMHKLTPALSLLVLQGYYVIKEENILKSALVICFFSFICLKQFPNKVL